MFIFIDAFNAIEILQIIKTRSVKVVLITLKATLRDGEWRRGYLVSLTA